MNDGDGGKAVRIAGPRARSGWDALIPGIGVLALAAALAMAVAGCGGKSAPANTQTERGNAQRSASTTGVVTHPTVRTFNAGENPHDLVAVGGRFGWPTLAGLCASTTFRDIASGRSRWTCNRWPRRAAQFGWGS